jgi:hypothetical protein
MISTWNGGQEDGHTNQVPIDALTGQLERLPDDPPIFSLASVPARNSTTGDSEAC